MLSMNATQGFLMNSLRPNDKLSCRAELDGPSRSYNEKKADHGGPYAVNSSAMLGSFMIVI